MQRKSLRHNRKQEHDMSKSTTTEATREDRMAIQRACYGRATTELRARYEGEFSDLLAAEYATAGITVKRRLTDAERAQRDAEKAQAKADKAKAAHDAKVEKARAELAALLGQDA